LIHRKESGEEGEEDRNINMKVLGGEPVIHES
jgi:hypothetical protein